MKKKYQQFYKYECTITGESYTVTREALHPKELISVNAFYDLNPDMDDRPEHIKKQLVEETPKPQ